MAREVANLTARFTADTTNLISGIDRAGSRLAGFARNTRQSLDRVGGQFLRMGAMGGALFAPAVLGAVRFESSMANAQAILGVADSDMAALNAEVLALGSNSVAGPQAAATAFFDIVSGVADASTHMDILAASIALAEAGQADLGTATSGVVALMNAYNLEGSQATEVTDLFTTTVGRGVGTMDEFVGAIGSSAGLAAATGVSMEELAASVAFLTTKGGTVASRMTQVNAAISSLINPNQTMIGIFNEMGVETGQAAIEAFGLGGALAMVVQTAGEADMAKALGGQEALQAAMLLSTEDANIFEQEFVGSMEGATEAARAIQLDTVAAQFAILKSQVSGLAIKVGSVLLPAMMGIMEAVIPIVSGIADWAAANPEMITGAAGLAGVMVTLGVALKGAAIAFGLLTSPITAGIALGVALWFAWTQNFLGIQDAVMSMVEAVTGAFTSLKTAFEEGGLLSLGEAILTGLLSGLGNLQSWAFTNVVLPLLDGMLQAIPTIVATMMSVGWSLYTGIIDGLGDIPAWVISNIIEPFISALASLPGRIANFINEAIPDNIPIAFGTISVNPPAPLPGFSVDLGTVNIPLPNNPLSFAGGTPFTGNGAGGFMAQLHPREAVVPAGGMMVTPSRNGLMLSGGGGMVINIENVHARNAEDLLDQLNKLAQQRGF